MKIALAAILQFSSGPWGPPLAARGLPGTEEAILHMAANLARLGHEVDVLTNCGPYAGTWDGVRWIDLPGLADPPDAYDVAVITGLDLVDRFAVAKRRYLWLHIDCDQTELLGMMDRIDKVMPLSQFSRSQYPQLPDSRVFVTRNGIVPDQFAGSEPRDPHRMVYGSDYDRGLLVILRLWPRIRAAVPDATLRVFYGFSVIDRKLDIYRETDPEAFASWTRFRKAVVELLEQDGVVHLGRIGHDAVAREFRQAGIWAYPCLFPETSCITAMKAQAAGAMPVVIPTAALAETVRWGLRTKRAPADYRNIDRDLAFEWLNALLAALAHPEMQERTRAQMMADARAVFDWRTIAAEWSAEFSR